MILTFCSSDPAPATAAMTAWRRSSSKYAPPGARAAGGATDSSTASNGGGRRAGGGKDDRVVVLQGNSSGVEAGRTGVVKKKGTGGWRNVLLDRDAKTTKIRDGFLRKITTPAPAPAPTDMAV